MMSVFPPEIDDSVTFGVLPVDFLLETVLAAGIQWFKTDPVAYKRVYGWLYSPFLNAKYGEAKALEIKNFLIKYDLKIVQSFALIDNTVPCISLQLLDGGEQENRAGLMDFAQNIDVIANNVLSRTEVSYSPIGDNIHIGIHVQNTPDLAKYIYYLVVYILNTFKPKLEAQGLSLGTFRATDISKLNEYLPENMYSRFINFSVYSPANFDRGDASIIENFIGLSADQGHSDTGQGNADPDGLTEIEDPDFEFGIHFATIGDSNGRKV